MKIKGIITAMVTPLNKSGKGINEEATRKLVNKLIDAGVHGLFILGTNGEFYSLNEDEKIELARIVVDEVNGRVPVFAGSGGISTEAVINLTNKFTKLGVDAVSVITPYLMKLNDEEIINHYRNIIQNTDIPIILYNIPANTNLNISERVFSELIKFEQVIGIKDSGGDIENTKRYMKLNNRPLDFSILIGSDSLILSALKLGADGAVAATSNVLTNTDLGIYSSFIEGDLSKAHNLQESINEFRRCLKFATVPSVLKYSVNLAGIDVGEPKLPVLTVSQKYHDEIKEIVSKYKNIEEIEGI